MSRQCTRGRDDAGLPRDCDFCLEASLSCDSYLACRNILRPHYVLPTDQMRYIHLTQINKERSQAVMGRSSSQYSHHATPISSIQFPKDVAYFRIQSLLERRNIRDLSRARQAPNSMVPTLSGSQPSVTAPLPRNEAPQDHEVEASAPTVQNAEGLIEDSQAMIDEVQDSSSSL